MKIHPLTWRRSKLAASLIHLAAVSLLFLGVGFMYANDNLGVGITRIQDVAFEDTERFSTLFNKDLNDIFNYIEYHEIFATDGSIDVTKRMLRMTYGPNQTVDYSLGDLIAYLQSLGYRLTEDFDYKGTPDPKLSAKSGVGYVDWTAAEPGVFHEGMSTDIKRSSLEQAALNIMSVLNRYYVTYNRLMVDPSNLHFKVVYSDGASKASKETVYTNDKSLTEDSAQAYGRYASLKGNSVFYDTNVSSISLSTISALAANNPYRSSTYYLLAAVDTSYPADDSYAAARSQYVRMRYDYIAGFLMMVIGSLAAVASLLYLLSVSGRSRRGDKTVTLHNCDRISTETGILAFFLLGVSALFLCRYTLVRLAHLVIPRQSWPLGEKVLYTAVLYLCCLLLFFSLLRRYKAETLWSNSLIFKCGRKCSIFVSKQEFTGRLVLEFFSYLILNTALISLTWYLSRKIHIQPLMIKIIIGITLAAWAALNIRIFYLLFRRQTEHARLHNAVSRLAAGETSYQVDLAEFDGKERELAEGINNISAGLETALQEKVKSERLKAELITNVSHDIKTPLTSIINYVDLIKREHIKDEKILRYLEILDQKSQRLKTLTEDLVEASKASSGNIQLEMSDIDFIELVCQTNGEFEEKFKSRGLKLITNIPDETYIVEADGRHLWRVLENLYNNAFKYAMDDSRIYVDITREDGEADSSSDEDGDGEARPYAVFTIKNISTTPLNIRAEDLTERFVRGDVARTTEGSGLGLSIAKSLTELLQGQFEIYIDGDLFKVRLAFVIKEIKQGIKQGGTSHAI